MFNELTILRNSFKTIDSAEKAVDSFNNTRLSNGYLIRAQPAARHQPRAKLNGSENSRDFSASKGYNLGPTTHNHSIAQGTFGPMPLRNTANQSPGDEAPQGMQRIQEVIHGKNPHTRGLPVNNQKDRSFPLSTNIDNANKGHNLNRNDATTPRKQKKVSRHGGSGNAHTEKSDLSKKKQKTRLKKK